MRIAIILGIALGTACGDPRAGFIGHYSGTHTRTTQTSAGPQVNSGNVEFDLTESNGDDRLHFGTGCMFTAAVETSTELQLDPIACPAFQGTSVSGLMATFADSFNAGTATLTNKTLTINQTGTQVGSNYSDGSPNQTYDFSEALTVTRQ